MVRAVAGLLGLTDPAKRGAPWNPTIADLCVAVAALALVLATTEASGSNGVPVNLLG